MNSKVIFFKQRSTEGDFSCANGEIESVVNARLIPVTATTDDAVTNPDSYTTPPDLINPEEKLAPLNELSSHLLPIVEFSLKPDVVTGWHNHPDNPPSIEVNAPKSKDAEGWATRAAYALDKLMTDATRQHLFVEPFFALCALRLTDGSHILPSSPVLLTPNATAPTVESGDNFTLDSMAMTIPVKGCRLRCRLTIPTSLLTWSSTLPTTSSTTQSVSFPSPTPAIQLNSTTNSVITGLSRQMNSSEESSESSEQIVSSENDSQNSVRVAAIDIFISSPIPLYQHNEPLLPVHRASGSTLPQSWLPAALTEDEFTSYLLSVSTFRLISTLPLETIPSSLPLTSTDSSDSAISPSASESMDSILSTKFFDVDFNVPNLPELPSVSAFTPDFLQHQSINAATGCKTSGCLTLCDLTLTLPTVPPIATLIQNSEHTYPSPSTPATQDPEYADSLQSTSAAIENSVDGQQPSQLTAVAAEIEVCKNGITLHSSCYDPNHPKVTLSESNFPNWLFIPEPDARQLTLVTDTATFVVPLRRHPYLNGAYYWSGNLRSTDLTTATPSSNGIKTYPITLPTTSNFAPTTKFSAEATASVSPTPPQLTLRPDESVLKSGESVLKPRESVLKSGESVLKPRESVLKSGKGAESKNNDGYVYRDSYRMPNAIWRTAKDRPLHFPDRLLMRLDIGRAIAICRAFRASGLVATTAPTLYLFTTHGVYLLKETDNGKETNILNVTNNSNTTNNSKDPYNGELRDAGLLTTHILDTPASLAISGRTLYFTTTSNTRIAITGTTVTTLPATLANPSKVIITSDDPTQAIEILTRPLKLETLIPEASKLLSSTATLANAMQWQEQIQKMLWSIELRGTFTLENPKPNPDSNVTNPESNETNAESNDANPDSNEASLHDTESLEIKLYGSTDLMRWTLLATSKGNQLCGLYTPGLRYARLHISGPLNGTLEALSIHP